MQNGREYDNNMLIEVYRMQLERWNKRRDVEWRLTLTIWSTILVVTLALTGKYQLRGFECLIHFSVLTIYYLWLLGLWTSNARDKHWVSVYQNEINIRLKLCSVDIEKLPGGWWGKNKKVLTDYSLCSQLCLTFLILLVSSLMLYFTPKSEATLSSLILKMLIK